MKASAIATVDEYIRQYPVPVQKRLKALRALIRKLVPEAQEKISYLMPCFYLEGALVYFGAHTRHIGFYPTASGIAAFRAELAGYECSKGAIQLPMDRPLPTALLTKIVRFRKSENLARAAARKKK